MKKGLIIGKGWVGSKLEKFLEKDFDLITTKRIADAPNCMSINFDENVNQLENISDLDFVVVTIPFGKRNTIEELNHRFGNLIQFIKDFKGTILLISSTGIYPNSENIVQENTYKDSELKEPYISIENKMKQAFPQLVILRLGGIMGNDRYISKYLDFSREGLDEVANHIHYQDILGVIKECLTCKSSNTIYNVVAPNHPTKKEILEYQINENLIQPEIKKGKTISPEKLISELNYQFIRPNPIYFKD